MNLPPYLASEISSRLLAVDPNLRLVFAMDEVPISGQDLENLMSAVWLAGYGEGMGDLGDIIPTAIQRAFPLPPLAAWIEANMR